MQLAATGMASPSASSSCGSRKLKRPNNADSTCKPKLTKTNSYIEGVELEQLTWTKDDEESFQNKKTNNGRILPDLSVVSQLDELSDGSPDNSPKYEDTTNPKPALKKHQTTIGLLSTTKAASSWNSCGDTVYHAFKVTSYILNPNYILRATASDPVAKYPRTVDYYLDHTKPENFPSWSDVETDIGPLLAMYEGCEEIPNELRDAETAIESITEHFLCNLEDAELSSQSSTSPIPPISDIVGSLKEFCKDLIDQLTRSRLQEELFADYFGLLLKFFCFTTRLPIEVLTNRTLSLDLTTPNGLDGKVMTVKPDFQLRIKKDILLVGEVKNFGVVSRQYEKSKGVHVKDPLKECQTTENDPGELSPDAGDDVQTVADDACSLVSKRYFRELGKKEKHKIDYILPQCFAEMLAAMDPNLNFGHCKPNESVQMGFILDAFKLRFVRLVLRNASSTGKPSVADIRSNNVRCDVFLTREMNLFKPKHIRMFFQIIHSIVHAYVFSLQ